MAMLFLETSALLKRYVNETGTEYILSLSDPAEGHALYVARITSLELTAAVARRRKGRTIRPKVAETILARIESDFTDRYHIVEISSVLLAEATALAKRHALRAYDAVQLAASSVVAQNLSDAGLPLTLISSDRELNAAATAEGMTVIDPLDKDPASSPPSVN